MKGYLIIKVLITAYFAISTFYRFYKWAEDRKFKSSLIDGSLTIFSMIAFIYLINNL